MSVHVQRNSAAQIPSSETVKLHKNGSRSFGCRRRQCVSRDAATVLLEHD